MVTFLFADDSPVFDAEEVPPLGTGAAFYPVASVRKLMGVAAIENLDRPARLAERQGYRRAVTEVGTD